MSGRLAAAALACAVLVGACTARPSAPDDDTRAATGPTTVATTAPSPSPSPGTPTTSPPSPDPDGAEDVVLGTGTVTVDGTELLVSGDCDISRDFGAEPVRALDDEVDVLLTVDNLTGDGGHDGPFALQVRLLGRGQLQGRTLVSEGAPGEEPGETLRTVYEGDIEVAELRERRKLEYLDVATLHLEASQRRTRGDGGPARRDLVVDVACPISRPPG